MKNVFKNNYNSFNKSKIKKFCTVPISETNYVPQGVCQIKDYILIGCYDYTKNSNSVIFVCSSKSTKMIFLDQKIHCGGMAYYEKTDSLFVTGRGFDNKSFINSYCGKKILELKNLSTLTVDKTFCVDDDCSLYSSSAKHSSPAYLTIYNNYLYVGNFVSSNSMDKNNCIIKKYKILLTGDLSSKYDIIKNPFSNTQGMCIFEYNNQKYYIFSRSFGRKRNSIINLCKINKDKTFYDIKAVVFPSMLEQINYYNEDFLVLLFESCAVCYSNTCISYNDGVYLVDFEKLLSCEDSKKSFSKGKGIFSSIKNIAMKGNYRQK